MPLMNRFMLYLHLEVGSKWYMKYTGKKVKQRAENGNLQIMSKGSGFKGQ